MYYFCLLVVLPSNRTRTWRVRASCATTTPQDSGWQGNRTPRHPVSLFQPFQNHQILILEFLPEVTLLALDKALCDRIPTNFNFLIYGNTWVPVATGISASHVSAVCGLRADQPSLQSWLLEAPKELLYHFLVSQFQNLRKILGFFILILPLASRIIFSSPSTFTSL